MMSFKNLSQRFEEKYKEIYGKYSARDDSIGDQPFLEFKPDDSAADDARNDSRFMAATSVSYRRDLTRLGRFLDTGNGRLFLIRQAELQTSNTFSETRILNPAFVIGNVPGVTRIRRPLGTATGLLPDDPNNTKSLGADDSIGSAGRLQLHTKEAAIFGRLGGSGATGILNLLPPNRITRILSGINAVFGAGQNGIVGVDDRPELDFDGQFFSTAVWRGFKPAGKLSNPLDRAGAELRRGNIKGAIKQLGEGIRRVVQDTPSPLQNLTDNDRGDPNNSSLSGWRYFVIDKNDSVEGVDRYINNSIAFRTISSGVSGKDVNVPVVKLNILSRKAKALIGEDVQAISAGQQDSTSSNDAFLPSSGGPQQSGTGRVTNPNENRWVPSVTQKQTQEIIQRNNFWRKTGQTISTIGKALFGNTISPRLPISNLINAANRRLQASPAESELNPGESQLTYPDMSLKSRFNTMLSSMIENKEMGVDDHKQLWQESFNKLTLERTFGVERRTLNFGGGFKPGDVIPDDIGSKNIKFDGRGNPNLYGRYLHDTAAERMPTGFLESQGENQPTDEEIAEIRNILGETTDFMFYDYGNKRIIPFRAFLTDMSENVSPNFREQQYIGRIERNIVYVGAVRELSFTFRVQSFHPQEMKAMWNKINLLTGLAFPAKYVNGFLAPPLVKLTIGNIYVDQPGYIKNISYKFDDDGWELDEKYQAPMGLTVNVSFSVIEKKQVKTGSIFYPYGKERDAAPTPSSPTTPAPRTTAGGPILGNISSPGALSQPRRDESRGGNIPITLDGKKIPVPSLKSIPSLPNIPISNVPVTVDPIIRTPITTSSPIKKEAPPIPVKNPTKDLEPKPKLPFEGFGGGGGFSGGGSSGAF